MLHRPKEGQKDRTFQLYPPFLKKGNKLMKNINIKACLAAALIAAMALTGCSDEKHIISYESGEITKEPENSPSFSADNIHAAILLPDDPTSGACMSKAHAEAFEAATSELGITSYTVNGAEADNAGELASDANVIFGAGYDYMNPLDAAARENPDKLYACFGGYKYNSTNYSNYYTAIYEAQYLAGVVAGTNSKSGKIGIISEYSSEYPDSAAEINSFAIGAKSANSEVEITVRSLGSRTDTDDAEAYTEELIDEGCDVISIQCDTSAPAEVASADDVFFIGYGADMSSYGDSCLTSVVWNLKDYYKSALTSAMDGTWSSGNYYGTLADGAVSLAPLSKEANTATQARIDSAAELIKNNLLEIFSNRRIMFDSSGKATVMNAALVDNKENIMISEDGTSYFIYSGDELKAVDASTASSDKLASASMNYLIEGVTVK